MESNILFDLFKKKSTTTVEVQKTTEQLVQEIHDEFYNEVYKLLAGAKISLSTDTTMKDLLDKCNRLKALGFTQTKEIVEAESEYRRLQNIRSENAKKEGLVRSINYFTEKYPHYKFITEESVKKICLKYNLIYGGIGQYRGTVPDSNLKQMELFKIHDDDKCCKCTEQSSFGMYRSETFIPISSKIRGEKENAQRYAAGDYTGSMMKTYSECQLEIVAPISDFDITGYNVSDSQLRQLNPTPDPVVLQPVYHSGNKYYLIVTAWGPEASDELVVNEKMN